MTSQYRAVAGILLSVFLFLIGTGLMTTFLPVRADMEGFSKLAIGLIGSAYFTGFVIGCIGAPRLLVRSGHVRTFAIAGGGGAASVLLQSIFVNAPVWGLARLMFGFVAACMYMVVESWLNDRATNATRGRIFAMYLTVNFGGILVGQSAYTLASPGSFVLFNLAAMCYALSLVPIGMTRLPQPEAAHVPSIRPWRIFKIAPVGVAGCVAVGFSNGAVWTLAPLYARGHGFDNWKLALFMVAFTTAGALVQTPIGRLSDRMDRRYVIATTSLLAGVAAFLLALLGGLTQWAAIGLFALHGATTLPIYGLSVAHTNDRVPRRDFIEASATLLLVNALASVIGPTLAAALMVRTSTAALFFFCAGIHAVHVLFVLWRLSAAERPEAAMREPYAPMPQQGTPSALELDPRRPETPDTANA